MNCSSSNDNDAVKTDSERKSDKTADWIRIRFDTNNIHEKQKKTFKILKVRFVLVEEDPAAVVNVQNRKQF